jgi:protein-disulfide isomerase
VAAGPVVKKIMDVYKGKVRLVIKNYPYKYRDYSRIAAEASLAAREQGKYWEMHDMLIKRSPKLDRASLIDYAKELNLDVRKFTESIDAQKFKKEIDRDSELAVKIDLYNTPTLFINGIKVVGERPFAYLKKIIDEELKNAKS